MHSWYNFKWLLFTDGWNLFLPTKVEDLVILHIYCSSRYERGFKTVIAKTIITGNHLSPYLIEHRKSSWISWGGFIAVLSTAIFWTELSCWRKFYINKAKRCGQFDGRVLQQTNSILMGTHCAALPPICFYMLIKQTSFNGFSRIKIEN
jgi:hypothetical protein